MVKEQQIQTAVDRTLEFLSQLEAKDGFRLFARSEITPYARCFVIFTRSLCKDDDWIQLNRESLIRDLNQDFLNFYKYRMDQNVDLQYDKPVLQLLCFTLSALEILKGDLSSEGKKIVINYLNTNMQNDFENRRVFLGSPGSGNYAMFKAILLYYRLHKLDGFGAAELSEWIDLHLSTANKFGFWGDNKSMQYLYFQNGYHQYEIFEAMDVSSAPWTTAARHTMIFSDALGHFAPYPGGGGCYDYDAIFMLTSPFVDNIGQIPIVNKTLNNVLREQNDDGGFCESKFIRSNRGFPRPIALFVHLLNQPVHCRFSSAIHGINLFRAKHSTVRTHWCETDRRWNESNAWDTFFRLSLIARVVRYLELPGANLFKVNEFPGIG